MLPRIDWLALFGVSCNALLGRAGLRLRMFGCLVPGVGQYLRPVVMLESRGDKKISPVDLGEFEGLTKSD